MDGIIDIAHLRSWIGRTEEARDMILSRLVDGFYATLGQRREPARDGDVAPLAVHWCLAPPIVANQDTGPDGHPARGRFLPPVPLPRRMWAGGELRFERPLRVGETVRRLSRVDDVVLKEGRSGRLCFVTVRHDILAEDGGRAIAERQDIVYRDEAALAGKAPPAAPTAGDDERRADISRAVDATPLMLFRYSALTFNGHRIHYDRTYARQVEHYPGLVVHGPLQATLLLHLGREAMPEGAGAFTFSYRGVHPLFDGAMSINLRRAGEELALWSANADGVPTMKAKLES